MIFLLVVVINNQLIPTPPVPLKMHDSLSSLPSLLLPPQWLQCTRTMLRLLKVSSRRREGERVMPLSLDASDAPPPDKRASKCIMGVVLAAGEDRIKRCKASAGAPARRRI